MGAQQSLQRNDKIEYTKQLINDIAASYIQSGTYTDMINVTNTEKCQQTIILTKDILKKNMTTVNIETLHSEIYKNKLKEVYVSPIGKIQTNNELLCKQIAEHYILIGNIFNMIKKAFLLNDINKANNDKNANLCANRLDKIKNENNKNSIINISKNIFKDKTVPDIDELSQLYNHTYKHEAINSYEQKQHSALKNKIDKTKQLISEYESKFDDVPYEIENTHSLAIDYNKIITNIEKQIYVSQLKLMEILFKIFYYDDNKDLQIRSNINGINIETLAKETMNIITEMYLTCENEFHKSVEFQEKIHKLKKLTAE